MRVVLDTNTVISALLWKGAERALLDKTGERPDIVLYSSPRLLAEIAEVLAREKFASAVAASGQSPEELMSRYLDVVNVVAPASVPPIVRADPDDDHVLACALAARAQFIVSGDSDLLDLKTYQGISIVGTSQALRNIESR